jgi:DNA modification methylase
MASGKVPGAQEVTRAPKLKLPKHWPVQDVEQYRPLAWFKPYAHNARDHPVEQLDLLAQLLVKYGPDQPIVVDEAQEILKGHGRLAGAERGGLTHFTFVQRFGLPESEKRAMRLADNQIALLAGWNKELVLGEIGSLKASGYNLQLLGFPGAQLRQWGVVLGDASGDPELAPRPAAEPVVRAGDLWELGEHRLLCGDATVQADVERVLGADRPHLMVTDQPYGVSYNAEWRNEQMPDTNPGKSGGSRGKVSNDHQADWRAAWQLFPGAVAYVWHGDLTASTVQIALEACDFEVRAQIIWRKQQAVIGRGHYHFQHEACWYAVRAGETAHWAGGRKQTTVWDIDKVQEAESGHSTQKPLACMQRPIENNSQPGDAVYEPFCGSGTTIIACELTRRRARAIEIDPAYVQVAIERWQTITGKLALLNGKTLDQVRTERTKRGARKRPLSRRRTPARN